MLAPKPSSRAPSGPPSLRSQATTPTGATTPHKAASHSLLPQHNSSTFKHKLKNMFDYPRTSTFAINLTIHELGNVPQLDGQFTVKWKFRGRKPPDGDRLLEHPVQRVHLLESKALSKAHPVQTLRNSTSVMSLRTVSTSSTSSGSPTSWKVNRGVAAHSSVPHHSSSLPPPSLSQSWDSTIRERKFTEPAPLRKTSSSTDKDSCRLIVEEPEVFTLPESPEGTDGSGDRPNSQETTTSTVPTLTTDGDTSTTQSVSSQHSPKHYPSSLGADTDSHSFVSTTQSIPTTEMSQQRVPSRASTRSDLSTNPSVVVSRHTRPGTLPSLDLDYDSTERKGRTPTRSIRSHAVAWDYKVQHVVRVPLGKPVEVEESNGQRHHHKHNGTATHKRLLPILGGGPLSESSLRLDIEQADQRGEAPKNAAGKDVLFGFVNIDLAPFADHGPVTRKFLLKSSKTNATIRITVDMRYIGGQQDWASPPMEGHIVQGLTELTGEDSYADLQLMPSRSISSSSDRSYPSSITGRPSSRSTLSLNKLPTSITAAAHSTKLRYRTYDHHLLPEVITKKQTMAAQRRQASMTITASPASAITPAMPYPLLSWNSFQSGSGGSASDVSPKIAPTSCLLPGEGTFTTSPLSTPAYLPKHFMTGGSSPSSTPGISTVPLSPTRTGSFGFSGLSPTGSPVLSPVQSRSSGAGRLSPNTTRLDTQSDSSGPRTGLISADLTPLSSATLHHHHTHYLQNRDDDPHELQPDLVIESIFNPKVGEEFTPFTYVKEDEDSVDEDDNDEDEDDDFEPGLSRSPRLDASLPLHAHHPTTWNKLRRRVMSHPHKLC